MISLEAALQSGILWYPSLKQKVFISRKIYLFPKSGLPLQLQFSNVAMKTRKWYLPALHSFTNNVCSLRLLEKTWQQLFLWVINLCRYSCGVICLVIARVIFLLQSDCSEITKVHNFSTSSAFGCWFEWRRFSSLSSNLGILYLAKRDEKTQLNRSSWLKIFIYARPCVNKDLIGLM